MIADQIMIHVVHVPLSLLVSLFVSRIATLLRLTIA
jgi:hypothetical protein